MGMFGKRSAQEKWDDEIEDLRDSSRVADRAAHRFERLGMSRQAAKQLEHASEGRKVANRMETCSRNPKNGGKGTGR